MPIYEYKCPKGHVFELFQKMTDSPPKVCEVCGESPIERVLYPVAVHFKGSGFYSTDYGKGGGRKPSRDGEKAEKSGDSSSEKSEKSDKKDKDVKKVAES